MVCNNNCTNCIMVRVAEDNNRICPYKVLCVRNCRNLAGQLSTLKNVPSCTACTIGRQADNMKYECTFRDTVQAVGNICTQEKGFTHSEATSKGCIPCTSPTPEPVYHSSSTLQASNSSSSSSSTKLISSTSTLSPSKGLHSQSVCLIIT